MKVFKDTVFWTFILFALTFAFGHRDKTYIQSFYFVSMLLPVIIGLNYFFNYYLVPRYLLTRKYWHLALYSLYTLIVSLYLEMLVLTVAFILLANYQYENLNPAATQVFLLCFVLYSVVFLNAFVLLVRRNLKGEKTIRELEENSQKLQLDTIVVRADRKNRKIRLEDILYFESLSDYVRINLSSSEPIITKEKISQLAESLPSHFVRIHRSYLINSNNIESFTREAVFIKEERLPVSRSYRQTAMDQLQKLAAT